MSLNNSNTRNISTDTNDTLIADNVVILMPVMIGAFIGNALVILAFIKGPRKIRTYTNYFVVNLAVSDFMVGCLSLPLWIVMNLGITTEAFNKYMVPLDILFGVTSIYSLVAISLERLYAVKYPAKHLNLQRKSVLIAITFIWSFGVVLFITESVIIQLGAQLHEAWVVTLVCLTFALPVITITMSYVILFTAASSLMTADNQTMSLTREIRIAKTISVIISLFCVCWAPFFLVNLLYAYKVIPDDHHLPVHITKALHYINSMMNVFVYAVRSPDFRHTFKKLICGCSHTVRERAYTVLSIKEPVNSSRNQLTVLNQKALINSSSVGTDDSDIPERNGNCRLSDVTFSETVFTDDEEKVISMR